MKQETRGNVCVFCASSANIDQRYLDDARELGRLLAESGWRCVNGGGAVGLMGAVTDGTRCNGSHPQVHGRCRVVL